MSPIEIRGSAPRQDELFTPDAMDFLVELDRRFAGARVDLLERRRRHRVWSTGGSRSPARRSGR
jgi:hypothetical protein